MSSAARQMAVMWKIGCRPRKRLRRRLVAQPLDWLDYEASGGRMLPIRSLPRGGRCGAYSLARARPGTFFLNW
jgi:hypothetical protein